MSFLVRIHDTKHERVWFELRDTEDEMARFMDSVADHHPAYVIVATELDHSPDCVAPWIKKYDT